MKDKSKCGICVYCRWETIFTSILIGLGRLRDKTVAEPAGPSFDGPEPATRWKGLE